MPVKHASVALNDQKIASPFVVTLFKSRCHHNPNALRSTATLNSGRNRSANTCTFFFFRTVLQAIDLLRSQIPGNFGELGERGLKVVHDLCGQDVRRGQVGALVTAPSLKR